jgi:hypothetical protein
MNERGRAGPLLKRKPWATAASVSFAQRLLRQSRPFAAGSRATGLFGQMGVARVASQLVQATVIRSSDGGVHDPVIADLACSGKYAAIDAATKKRSDLAVDAVASQKVQLVFANGRALR